MVDPCEFPGLAGQDRPQPIDFLNDWFSHMISRSNSPRSFVFSENNIFVDKRLWNSLCDHMAEPTQE